MLRDHEPIVIEEFNGLWRRGDADSVPLDHFYQADNIQYIESGFETRDGIDTFTPSPNTVRRMYNYKTQDTEGLIILNAVGEIYHALVDGSNTLYGPVLTIPEMTDFGFQSYNGRAYITPYTTETDGLGRPFQRGLQNEFVYVYKGDGTAARKAAGFPPSNSSEKTMKAFNSRFDGTVTKGVHLFAVLFDGTTLGIEVFPVVYAPGAKEIELTDIPIGPPGTTSRVIIMTRAIDPKDYEPDQTSYTYYTAVTISDNTTTYKRISVPDSALVAVAALGVIPAVTGMQAENTSEEGFADLGFHLIACVYETDTGYLTALGPENFASVNVIDLKKAIKVTNIPVSPDSFVVKRHLVATRAIANYNGDQTGYQFYFIPEGTLENNVDTELNVSFYDADLLDDASHLIDNFSEIPAGVCLTTYHGRMVLTTTYDDISLAYLSAPGEPEAFDQVDGLIIVPLDGNPITIAQEFRDVLYLFKRTRTYAVVDNSQVPSEWAAPLPLDRGGGAPVHGVATVLDSNGVNVDYLLVISFSGLMIFNGAYALPELSWKIQDWWYDLDQNEYHNIQIMNDTLSKVIYLNIYDRRILMGDYKRGLDPQNIRWAIWNFDIETTSIALISINRLLIGETPAE